MSYALLPLVWPAVVLALGLLFIRALKWRWRDRETLSGKIDVADALFSKQAQDIRLLWETSNGHHVRLTRLDDKARELEQLVKPDPNPKPAAPRRSA